MELKRVYFGLPSAVEMGPFQSCVEIAVTRLNIRVLLGLTRRVGGSRGVAQVVTARQKHWASLQCTRPYKGKDCSQYR